MSAQKYTPNQSEIDRCLQDAGVSDPKLSFEEKLVFYKAIKVSEGIIVDVQPCVQETETKKEGSADPDFVSSDDKEEGDNWESASVRRIPRKKQNLESRQQTTASKSKTRQKQNHPPETRTSPQSRKGPSSNSDDSQNRTNEPPRKADHSSPQKRTLKNKVSNNVVDLDGSDARVTPHSSLKLIKKSLAYEVPFLFSKTLNRMPFSEKVKAIYEHHVSLNEKYRQAQRRSRKFAKWGNPISSSSSFNGSLEKNPNQSQNETSDNETELIFLNIKEVAGSDNQRTKKSPSPNAERFIEMNDVSSVLLNTDPPLITDRKTIRLVEISNESDDYSKSVSRNLDFDIIKDDLTETSPGRRSYSKNTSRSELLFQNLVIEDKKKAQQKIAMQKFEQTLISLGDEEAMEESKHNTQKAESDELVMVKQTRANEKGVGRRVSPPNPYVTKNRKNLRRRGPRGENSKAVAAKKAKREHSNNSDDDFIENHSKRRSQIIDVGEISPKDDKVECPICNKLLPKSKIEEHAEFCKASDENSVPPALYNTETLTCHVCDEVFRFNTEYEVHVKECITEHMRKK